MAYLGMDLRHVAPFTGFTIAGSVEQHFRRRVPNSARIRDVLHRLIAIRDTGRDIDGEISVLPIDDVIDGINTAECALRPRIAAA